MVVWLVTLRDIKHGFAAAHARGKRASQLPQALLNLRGEETARDGPTSDAEPFPRMVSKDGEGLGGKLLANPVVRIG